MFLRKNKIPRQFRNIPGLKGYLTEGKKINLFQPTICKAIVETPPQRRTINSVYTSPVLLQFPYIYFQIVGFKFGFGYWQLYNFTAAVGKKPINHFTNSNKKRIPLFFTSYTMGYTCLGTVSPQKTFPLLVKTAIDKFWESEFRTGDPLSSWVQQTKNKVPFDKFDWKDIIFTAKNITSVLDLTKFNLTI